jgi:hypothetical protein
MSLASRETLEIKERASVPERPTHRPRMGSTAAGMRGTASSVSVRICDYSETQRRPVRLKLQCEVEGACLPPAALTDEEGAFWRCGAFGFSAPGQRTNEARAAPAAISPHPARSERSFCAFRAAILRPVCRYCEFAMSVVDRAFARRLPKIEVELPIQGAVRSVLTVPAASCTPTSLGPSAGNVCTTSGRRRRPRTLHWE